MTAKPWTRSIGCSVLLLTASAHAAVRRPSVEPATVTAERPARVHRDVAWQRDGQIAGWTAIMDRDTGVPVRWWGPGLAAPGAERDPAAAVAAARAFLAAHMRTLAPGATPADFVVVTNQLDGDLRSVGFAQLAGGVPVRGGAISFAFKRDRLIMVGSTALPDVPRLVAANSVQRPAAAASAVRWLAGAGQRVTASAAGARMIVPIVHPHTADGPDITYHLADEVSVATTAGEPGAWRVFVDASTGAAFARESTIAYASGAVLFDVPDRAPRAAAGRHPQPAGDAIHVVNGVEVAAGADGVVTWAGTADAHIGPGLRGPYVTVFNSNAALTTGNLTLPDDGSCLWTHPDDELVDAQIDAFIYANQAKQFARARLAPGLAFLAQQLPVTVNETVTTCNAYSSENAIHLLVGTPGMCENTGRMADVVYHEFGHTLHHHAIIDKVGAFDPAMSEGAADTFAIALTGDPGVGRGFFLDDRPLRDLAPAVKKVWPRDATGEQHDDGEIFAQTLWDLRQALEADLGRDAGFAQFLKIYYTTMQRAVDIPSSFAEALVGDDDDGDLGNGTPNECAIIAAYAAHGLFDPSVTGGVAPPTRDGFQVAITGAPAAAASCHAPSISSATMQWRTSGGTLADLAMVADGDTLRAAIPPQPDGAVVEYRVLVTLSNGITQAFPSNAADPLYQFATGTPHKIWCADFEAGADGWTHTAAPAAADHWEVGAPRGLGGDPAVAHGGANVLGMTLAGSGRYASVMTTMAQSPNIDLQGYANVHLQYYRWLGVQDGWYDQASILANDRAVWSNYTSATDPVVAMVNHIDQEWRFQDVDLHEVTSRNSIKLTFALTSDTKYEAGGWTLDDVCLVGFAAVCGNHIRESGETCDDGNAESGDGCSASCAIESDTASEHQDGGCSAGGSGGGALALLLLGLRRRYRLPSLR